MLLSVIIAILPAQESVYGPAAPPDAGFVRVINVRSDGEPVRLDVGSQRLDAPEAGDVSPYRPVVSGVYLPQIGGLETELFVRPEGYTSLAVTDDAIAVIADTVHEDPARAQLVLYNFGGGGPISLTLSDTGQGVIEGVPFPRSSSLAVNAVSAAFSVVYDPAPTDDAGGGGGTIPIDPIQLRRGRSYSFVVHPQGGEIAVSVSTASVELEP